ncbi:MAG: hypothetical protein ACRC1P_10125 [Cellulosilyticaceae bacterium]
MKNARNKIIAAALILSLGATPVIGCTTVPKANTNRSNGVVEATAEAKTEERKSTTPVKPETKPTPASEAKPNEPAKPETKPSLPTPTVKPGEPAKPETKPSLPTPTVKPSEPAKPETKPNLPTPTVKPSEPAKPETKPSLPTPTVKPSEPAKPETKPNLPTPTVKPEVKPTSPVTKPETCKPCKPNKPCKGEKPSEGFMIDNFKIIQQALEKLGVKPSELESMIKEGKKLTDVLEVKNISYNKFRKVLYKEYCIAIKEGVKNGQITKEEGKLLQSAIKQKVMSWMKDKK